MIANPLDTLYEDGINQADAIRERFAVPAEAPPSPYAPFARDLIDTARLEGADEADLVEMLLARVGDLEQQNAYALDLVERYRLLYDSVMHRAKIAEERIQPLMDNVAELTDKALNIAARFLSANAQPAPHSAGLDQADTDLLDGLAQRHTGRGLAELVSHLSFGTLDAFRAKYTTLAEAQKSLASRIVDARDPVMAYMGETKMAKNGSLYFSVNFGFNNVSLFNGDVAQFFAGTTNNEAMTNWRQLGFSVEFAPPLQITMEREANGYPRIVKIEEIN